MLKMYVTMKDKLKAVAASLAVAAILTGCVSTKKYKASQAALQQVRNDSAQLAQQTASLNGNVKDLQEKNANLQQELDKSKSGYAESQKSLNYYQDYFTKQQTAMGQVSDQVKSALSQAGITDADVTQENNIVYVRLDEDKIFKRNSYIVSADGKKALTGLAGSIKDRPDVNVFVSDGDSSGAQGNMSMSGNNMSGSTGTNDNGNMSGNAPASDMPAHHTMKHHTYHHHATTSNQSGSTASASKPSGTNQPQPQDNGADHTAVAHHKPHHRKASSEGAMTYYSNNMGNSHKSRAWALQQGRMYAVANHMLQDGVPKVNLMLHQQSPEMSGPSNTIKVVITPTMNDFKPEPGTK